MAKEILIYSYLGDYSAQQYITSLDAAADEDVTTRLNSPGGSVFSSWGMCAKISEHGNVLLKVDGFAGSMAAFFPLFAKKTECLDITRFMIHRADMYTSSPEEMELLASINKDLKAKMKAKIDDAKLKELKGVTIDDIFDAEQQTDVWLTAREAKQIGLVQKVNSLKPTEIEAYTKGIYQSLAAMATLPAPPEANTDPAKNSTTHKMNLQELKDKHPEAYQAAFAEGANQAHINAKTWVKFIDIDPKGVKEGIEKGGAMEQDVMADFMLKGVGKLKLNAIAADSPGDVETGDAPKNTKEGAHADFKTAVKSLLDIK